MIKRFTLPKLCFLFAAIELALASFKDLHTLGGQNDAQLLQILLGHYRQPTALDVLDNSELKFQIVDA